jgi:hypothetical protein
MNMNPQHCIYLKHRCREKYRLFKGQTNFYTTGPSAPHPPTHQLQTDGGANGGFCELKKNLWNIEYVYNTISNDNVDLLNKYITRLIMKKLEIVKIFF